MALTPQQTQALQSTIEERRAALLTEREKTLYEELREASRFNPRLRFSR